MIFLFRWTRNIALIIVLVGMPFMSMAQSVTSSRDVTLNVHAPGNVIAYIEVASNPSFANAERYTPVPTLVYDICRNQTSCPSGTYTVYVRLIDTKGALRFQNSRTVVYRAPTIPPPPPVPDPTPIPDPEPLEEDSVIDDNGGETSSDTINDINTPDVFLLDEQLPDTDTPDEILPEEIAQETEPRTIADIFASRTTQGVISTLAVAGMAGMAGASVGSLFGSSFQISYLIMIPIRLWNFILVFLGIRKKSQPWGLVYDAQTKQPLDPVYVQLLDQEGKEVATSITDIEGRYGFLIQKPGIYTLKAGKTGYIFPSQSMLGAKDDILYSDLYFGEPIEITTPGQILRKNIPLDPPSAGPDWNQAEKERLSRGHVSGVSLATAYLTNIIFFGGLAFTLVSLIFVTTVTNGIFLLVYIIFFILRMVGFKPRTYGVIRRMRDQSPVANAIIKVFHPGLDQRVAHAIADEKGRYYALAAKGNYYVTVEEKIKTPEGEKAQEIYRTKPFTTKQGIINRSLKI